MNAESKAPITLRNRLTVRLTAGVTTALLLIGVPFLLAFHRLRRNQQLDVLEEAAGGLSSVIVASLRSAMLAGQPHFFDEVIRGLSGQPEVERVILLDPRGRVKVTSDPSFEGKVFDRQLDATCQVCHRAPDRLPASRITMAMEGNQRVFRTMSTVPNEPRCHSCHDANASINGILLMDLSLPAAHRGFFADIGGTVALGVMMVLLTIAVLVLLLRKMVHQPLRQVVSTSRKIVEGDREARVPITSSDEFAFLAAQVNQMTDHLAQSIQSIETHRRELQAVLDGVDDEIVVLDRDRRLVAANQAFLTGSGLSEQEAIGRLCRSVSAWRWPCAEERGGCPVEKVFQTGRLHKGILSRVRPNGKERAIEVHASPLRGPDGEVQQVVEVRRDISERRQMEATLAHSERLASLGLLASGLSHEINNPLGAIQTSVEGLHRRLAEDPGSPEEANATLRRIAKEVQRARAITDRLLKVARPVGSTRTLIDVNRVVEDILAILSFDIKRAGIVTRTELAERLPPLCGDESRLAQILMNLALNSVQAMSVHGGSLRIVTAAENGAVRMEVEDTGEGIPPENMGRIYEPFFTTKPAGKGTGLGLFITHRMVTEMNGTIEVHSQSGRGTLFTVRLPANMARESE